MLGKLFLKYQSIIYQFSRFAGIGFLNTAVDFSVINILISLTGSVSGMPLAIINTASFTIAVFHSYFWNKFWAFGGARDKISKFIIQLLFAAAVGMLIILAVVFGAGREYAWFYFTLLFFSLLVLEVALWKAFGLRIKNAVGGEAKQFSLFLVVSVIGIIINSAVVGLITAYIPAQFGTGPVLWANLAKIAATVIALTWNFIGYKFFVFKK